MGSLADMRGYLAYVLRATGRTKESVAAVEGLSITEVEDALDDAEDYTDTAIGTEAAARAAGDATNATAISAEAAARASAVSSEASARSGADASLTTAIGSEATARIAGDAAIAAAAVNDGDAAGGDLGGTYPNPDVNDDSHNHTYVTAVGAQGGAVLQFNTTTGATPGSGHLNYDNATAASVTGIYVSNAALYPLSITSYLVAVGQQGFIAVESLVTGFRSFFEYSANTTQSGKKLYSVVYRGGATTLPANNELVSLRFYPGLSLTSLQAMGVTSITDLNTAVGVETTARAAADTAHAAAGDPHAQYALDTDLSTHAGASDPHTGYRLESASHDHNASAADASHGGALSTVTRTLYIPINAGITSDASTIGGSGTAPDRIAIAILNDAATTGVGFTFLVPSNWASGVLTFKWLLSGSSNFGAADTIRLTTDYLEVADSASAQAAGTTVTTNVDPGTGFVANDLFTWTDPNTITPSAANNLVRAYLQRIGANAADDYTGNLRVIGLRVDYTASR